MLAAGKRLGFELLKTDGAARLGRITTQHGVIETPVFMPVGTLASVKSLTTAQLNALLFEPFLLQARCDRLGSVFEMGSEPLGCR